MDFQKTNLTHERNRFGEFLFGFSRESGNQRGTQGDIGNPFPNVCDQVAQGFLIARTAHPF